MFTLKNLLRVHSTLNIKSRGRKEVRKTEDRIWAGTSNAGLCGSDPRSGSGATGISKSELKIQELVVGAWRFELQTSCAQDRRATSWKSFLFNLAFENKRVSQGIW